MLTERIRYAPLQNRIMTPNEAAARVKDGMVVGLSGFTRSGDAKVVPTALIDRVKKDQQKLQIDVYTGASLGEVDGMMAEAGIIHKRLPFQADRAMRHKINSGELLFIDQHLSSVGELIRSGAIPDVDIAIVEAVAITEKGYIVPSTSVGNNPIFISRAKEVIVELNTQQPLELEGIHDIYMPDEQIARGPIPLVAVSQRIGIPAIPVNPDKISGVVLSDVVDTPSSIQDADSDTQLMAEQLIAFLRHEVAEGRLPENLMPIQAGVGSIANAVLHGFLQSEFTDLTMYSEVLQDAVFDLIDAGKICFASASSVTLSERYTKKFRTNIEKYKRNIILRPQEISNHPELIRRLGLIAINAAVEVDIYGNVNSTHVLGSQMINGIGGSADFARNARLTIFVTKSVAKGGHISRIVPFVSHVDHSEHAVDVIVTEHGIADVRGLAPVERAKLIIENCSHPDYRQELRDYFEAARKRGGHTPHVLEKAFSFHERYAETGTMKR